MSTAKDFVTCLATPINGVRFGAKAAKGELDGAYVGNFYDARQVTPHSAIAHGAAGLFTAAEIPVAIGFGGLAALSFTAFAPFSGECAEGNREVWNDEGEIWEEVATSRAAQHEPYKQVKIEKSWTDARGPQSWPSSSKK